MSEQKTAAAHNASLTGVAEVSDGRAAMLAIKSAELRREWIRAENAEGRCERLRAALLNLIQAVDADTGAEPSVSMVGVARDEAMQLLSEI